MTFFTYAFIGLVVFATSSIYLLVQRKLSRMAEDDEFEVVAFALIGSIFWPLSLTFCSIFLGLFAITKSMSKLATKLATVVNKVNQLEEK